MAAKQKDKLTAKHKPEAILTNGRPQFAGLFKREKESCSVTAKAIMDRLYISSSGFVSPLKLLLMSGQRWREIESKSVRDKTSGSEIELLSRVVMVP